MAVDTRKFVDYDNEAYIVEKNKNTFVAKEVGKGLSEANFTQQEKAKLANIESGAEANVNPDWSAQTGDAAILNKPTKLSDFTNDVTENDYTTAEKSKLAGIEAQANKTVVDNAVNASSTNPISNSAIKDYVDRAVAAITGINFSIVQTLPATGETGTIYLVPNSGSSGNSYDEYIWIDSNFEKIGTTDVDLSDYMKETDMVPLTTAEIDALFV